MRALVQRVSEARVTVAGESVGAIGPGLLVLVCAMAGDGPAEAARLARKIAGLRIFPDAQGRMNLSLRDTGGAVLAVSQFTLAAETRGARPSFSAAAPPETGRALCEAFVAEMRGEGLPVETGVFGAKMAVALVNDGPVTIWLDTAAG